LTRQPINKQFARNAINPHKNSIFFSAAFTVASLIRGSDEDCVRTRRNILRYLCLSQVLLLRDISIKVRRRFPTIESVVQAGQLFPSYFHHQLLISEDFLNP
jgi:hypothetical protein